MSKNKIWILLSFITAIICSILLNLSAFFHGYTDKLFRFGSSDAIFFIVFLLTFLTIFGLSFKVGEKNERSN